VSLMSLGLLLLQLILNKQAQGRAASQARLTTPPVVCLY